MHPSLIKKLPKADLHIHLDGSLRLSTLIEESKKQGLELPSFTEEGLKDLVFKNFYKDLPDYLKGFQYTCKVLQDLETLERVSYELLIDSYEDGIIHIEPRYAPELLKSPKTSTEDVILAIEKGFQKALKEINEKIKQENSIIEAKSQKPEFSYSHIICAIRTWDPSKSIQAIQEAYEVKKKHDIALLALDLAGAENGFPAIDHLQAFNFAHEKFFYKTVHAGEAYGPSSIFQAISHLHADRIGHGFHLFNYEMINTTDKSKANKYVENLVRYIAEKRITIEVCLTSNLQTLPELKGDLKNHSLAKMLENGLSVAICTDNRLVSNTTISKELALAQSTFDIKRKLMKKIIMYGIKRSFYPANYLKKKEFIDKCSKYYDYISG